MVGRKTIGVIIDTMDGPYQTRMTEGLIKEAEKQNFDMMFFSGVAVQNAVSTSAQYNTIFNMPNSSNVDGVILVLSSLENFSGDEGSKRLAAMFHDLPMVSISIPIDNALNVMLDNKKSMDLVIEHVLTHVAMKDVAYISGPLKNVEACHRFDAYKARLEEHELDLKESFFYEGNFQQNGGTDAVDHFHNNNIAMPKAIIAANDEMAIGAFLRLRELGYRVPNDIIITGFDNIDAAQVFFPPITTFDQQSLDMSRVAVKKIGELLEGKAQVGEVLTVGNLITRESCGCSVISDEFSQLVYTEAPSETHSYDDAVEMLESYMNQNIKIFEEIVINAVAPFSQEQNIYRLFTRALLQGFLSDVEKKKINGRFISEMNEMANYAISSNNLNCHLSEMTVKLRDRLMTHIFNEDLNRQVQDILYMANTVMGKSMRRKVRHHQFHFRRMYLMSRDLVHELNSVSSIFEILSAIKHSLPLYGISRCYVCLYDHPISYERLDDFSYPADANLVMGYSNGREMNAEKFKTNQMLPKSVMATEHRKDLLFLALFDEHTQFGYIAFSPDGIDPLIYETLRAQVSSTLKRHELNEKRIKAEKALYDVMKELEISNTLLEQQSVRDELTGLYNRRGFYQKAELYYTEVCQSKEPFYAIYGDIDGLKQINDVYGHNEGDVAIRRIAKVLKEVIGSEQIIARVSGDEFTILLKKTEDVNEVEALIEEINQHLEVFNQTKNKPYNLGISLGYGAYDYEACDGIDELLKSADRHLYREKTRKKRGGSNVFR